MSTAPRGFAPILAVFPEYLHQDEGMAFAFVNSGGIVGAGLLECAQGGPYG